MKLFQVRAIVAKTVSCMMPILNEVHVSTHEEKIELKQPSFPLKPSLFCSLQYRLLSHIVIGFHLRAGVRLPPLGNFG